MNISIDAKCSKCGSRIVISELNGLDYQGYCAKCHTPVFGSVVLRSEVYRSYDIVLSLESEGFRFHIMRRGTKLDVSDDKFYEEQDEAIAQGKEFIDGIPKTDSI